jgi:hypothetical protein
MRHVHNSAYIFWRRIVARPFMAKIAACILLFGIIALATSPDAWERGRAAASQLSKPYLPSQGKQTTDTDCSAKIHASDLILNPQP